MISVQPLEDKTTWENFNLASSNPSFLQSWVWGQFQKALGKNIFRLGVYEDSELVGVSLVIEEKAKVASFFYVPAGPVLTDWSTQAFAVWLNEVEAIAKEKDVSFLRVDPRILPNKVSEILKAAGFLPAPVFTQPECTGVIDLTKSEEELRSNLSDSTRYNINAAARKGVGVREGEREEIDSFLKLLKETTARKALTLPKEAGYHKKQFETLGKGGIMKLFIAESDVLLSAVLVVFYGRIAYYLHAANSLTQKNLRASYPLVWHSVLEAKKAGIKKFDFWGMAKTDDQNDPWAGVTAFKLSFGAARECYEPPYDLPYKGSYQFSRVIETWRRPLQKILRFGR